MDATPPTPAPRPQFILASQSARRVQYLREAGYRFEVAPADVPEHPAPGEPPADYALRVALAKARAAQAGRADAVVIGADTDVVLDGRVLGKPRDVADAATMLSALAGRTHQVVSAVVIVQGQRSAEVLTATEIDFVPLTRGEIESYVGSGEPMGKAGAYAIQGAAARFVRAVRGSYTGVVGLPLAETCDLLATFDIYPGEC